MNRYINADETIMQIKSDYKNLDVPKEWGKGINFSIGRILRQQTADVREVVYGEWEIYKYDENAYDIYGNKSFAIWYRCSNCGFIHAFIDNHIGQYNFCPNCGADMGEG